MECNVRLEKSIWIFSPPNTSWVNYWGKLLRCVEWWREERGLECSQLKSRNSKERIEYKNVKWFSGKLFTQKQQTINSAETTISLIKNIWPVTQYSLRKYWHIFWFPEVEKNRVFYLNLYAVSRIWGAP